MIDPEFESPLFKVLAKNDTGQRSSHQGGFVLPKDLRKYFPVLQEPTPDEPTPDIPIRAILVDGGVYLGEVDTRYQLQSWGGTRSGETRITGGVDQLLNSASADDILLVERKIDSEYVYRLTLIRTGSDGHGSLSKEIGTSRWGVLPGFDPPVDEAQIEKAEDEIVHDVTGPFVPFQEGKKSLAKSLRVARSRAFARLVLSAYKSRCAICGGGLRGADGRTEIEAAHIIGKAHNGADDVRNGLGLCRSDHWAFDNLICSVDAEMRLRLKAEFAALPENKRLADLAGKPIRLPADTNSKPHLVALKWHYDRVFAP